METKLVLALVGALLGWGIKAIWDEFTLRRRWRRLAPLVLRQLEAAGKSAAASFDLLGLPRVIDRLETAQRSAIELVAAGVRVNDWVAGLQHIAECLDATQAAEVAPPESRGAALKELRDKAKALGDWARHMRPA